MTEVTTYQKESFKPGEIASLKTTTTYEYGSDRQITKVFEAKTEYFDASGNLLMTDTGTKEFDEDGLQTSFTKKVSDNTGAELNETVEITWTKDADNKPISFQIVVDQDGAGKSTCTGDVELDESGLISKTSNVKVNGQTWNSTTAIEHIKISNPLPNAYEGWKSYPLTDLILS